MTLLEIFILALALSADAFSVGAAVGLRHPGARQVFRLSFHFGLFQSLMSLAGALAGAFLLSFVESSDHWIVMALLVAIGARMIYAAWKGDAEKYADTDLTRGFSLIGLSLAVSIDALGAGVSLPASNANIPVAVAVIGLVSAAATFCAMRLADKVRAWMGRRCEIIAGIVLILLGIWTPINHLGLL
ncbi:manganese efflux pump [candidate division KSB1 bacterium]|nr:MAG: manganese efflux pump [candidate division KSB1 bacterium]